MALLTKYHIRGMADSAGSPGTIIATEAVEHHDDGSVYFTRPNGMVVRLQGPTVRKLLEDILNIHLVGDEDTTSST
jgi:hypothetical protein